METGKVGEDDESETQPTQTESPFTGDTPQTSVPQASAASSKVANVKDAFDDLFNN